MTLQPGPAARLTIYLKTNAHWHRRSVRNEIMERARAAGLAGASVFHGDEGFGRSEHIHVPRLLSLNGELPCTIAIVDEEHKLRAFLPRLEEILEEGVAVIQPVEVLRHLGGSTRHR